MELFTRSLSNIFWRCLFTVFMLIDNVSAISLLNFPLLIKCNTSFSLSDNMSLQFSLSGSGCVSWRQRFHWVYKKPSEEFSFDGFLWGILIFSFLFQRGILHEPDVLQFRYSHLHPNLQALHQFYLFLLNWNIQKFLRYDRYPLLRLKNNQCWF